MAFATDQSLTFGALVAAVGIFQSDDIILTEIAADWYLDRHHRKLAGVLHSVHRAKRNLDRFILGHEFDLFIDFHGCIALHNDRVFRAVMMAWKTQGAARLHHDLFDLKAITSALPHASWGISRPTEPQSPRSARLADKGQPSDYLPFP